MGYMPKKVLKCTLYTSHLDMPKKGANAPYKYDQTGVLCVCFFVSWAWRDYHVVIVFVRPHLVILLCVNIECSMYQPIAGKIVMALPGILCF